MPDFSHEDNQGGATCGIDEAGRAPLAGPVVAACVFVPPEKRPRDFWGRVNDSKALSKSVRENLYETIREHAFWGIGQAEVAEIDRLNIGQANFLAMQRAFAAMSENFGIAPDVALIDGHICPRLPCRAVALVKGDSKSLSIAAASILAKVTRDRIMEKLAAQHPTYGWERNAGYPVPEHLAAIDAHGVTIHHRRSFAPVRNYIEYGSVRVQTELAF